MAEQPQDGSLHLSGALIGWSRVSARHGVILTLQVIENAEQFQEHRYHQVNLALNERQLRSLARDLARATRSRGLALRAKAPLHRRLWNQLKSLAIR